MSGATVEYSIDLQQALNGDQISAMCLAPSVIGFSFYWNNFFIGTSNGHLYFYSEGLGTPTDPHVQLVAVTGYTGTLSGAIVSLTTDPAGKYLFLTSPTDGKFLRMKLSAFTGTSIPVDSNIYRFGGNTGGVAITTQNNVYFVTSAGNAISTVANFGVGIVNLFFRQPTNSNSTFEGLAMSTDESTLYIADSYTGNIYLYDFTAGTNSLEIAACIAPRAHIANIAVPTSNDIFYSRTDSNFPGVYLFDVKTGTDILVAGGGSNTNSTSAQNYKLILPKQIVIDPLGDLYVASVNANNHPLLTRVMFNPLVRSPIAATIPAPKFPNCGLPAPGNCKKVVIPFNPTTYWGFAPPQRVAVYRPAPIGSNSLSNCYNTFVQLCPTIPPSRVNPIPPLPPVQPIAPIYPVETPTSQYTTCFVSTGTMNNLRTSCNIVTIPDTSPLTSPTFTPMAFGPQGYIYFTTRSGTVNVLTTSGGTLLPSLLYTLPQGDTVSTDVVVSSTGLAAVTTDGGILRIYDQTGLLRHSYTLNGQLAGSPLFLDSQSLLVAAYGNTITAYDFTTGNVQWSSTLASDQFSSSISTDGVSLFVGTLGGNVVSYSTQGSLYWIYATRSQSAVNHTPYPANNLLTFFASNTVYAIDKSPTRFGGGTDTIVTLSGIGNLHAPPILFSDATANTWLYFTTDSNRVYAAGNFLGVSGAFVDPSGGNMGNFWSSFESNILSNTSPVIDGNGYVYVCDPTAVYRYTTPPTSNKPSARTYVPGNFFGPSSGQQIYTSPIISSQNKLSFVAYLNGQNYVYTLPSS